MTRSRWGLALVVAVYVALAAGYAVVTPRWQNPDEPAHYNYIAHLAQGRGLPVLQMGDYDAAYLEQLKAAGFPAHLPVDGVRYEGYQPPLYYLLAVPVYWAAAGPGLDAQVLALRLFSVLLGALLVVAAHAVARQALTPLPPTPSLTRVGFSPEAPDVNVWAERAKPCGLKTRPPKGAWPSQPDGLPSGIPGDPENLPLRATPSPPSQGERREGATGGRLSLGAAAFVAFVPMHTAMTAAINNDTLAELLIAALLWLMLRRLQDRCAPRRYAALAGVLLGLALLTKVSTYLAVPLLLFVELARWWPRGRRATPAALSTLIAIAAPAALLTVPWFARNLLVYGLTDPLGKGRHDAVVVGQLTTAAFAAQHGWLRLGHDFLVTSFRSFWGQFGWMGLVLDARVYLLLLALSVVAGVGLLVRLGQRRPPAAAERPDDPGLSTSACALLALTILLALGVYAGYNLTLLQHQGRYLFPAIVPLGVFFAIGLWTAWQRRASLVVAGALALILVARLLTGLFASGSGAFDVVLWGGGAALLAGRSLAPGARVARLAYAASLVALTLINAWCLLGLVRPYFRP